MIPSIRKATALAAALAAISLFGAGPSARAGFVIKIEDVTTASTKSFTFGTAAAGKIDTFDLDGNKEMIITTTVGNLAVSVEVATSDSPGTPSIAFVNQSGSSITNKVASSQQLRISVTDTGFMMPTSPPPAHPGERPERDRDER